MSFEPGGRADKYGNEYENQYLARLLLLVVNGEISSVTVEPLDEFSDSIEYTSESSDGRVDYYQCKSSNGSNKSWTVLNLKKNNIFSRIKELLIRNQYARYHFISPLPAIEMQELCKRARTCQSPKDYKAFSLTNVQLRNAFRECALAFGFADNGSDNLSALLSILSRCFFEQIPYTESATLEFEEFLGLTFTGNSTAIRILLEHYINGNGKYGVRITAKDIIDFLALNNHQLRVGFHTDRPIQRINELNQHYWVKSPGINGKLLHRSAADEAIQAISNLYSVVLYGKAGAGKSGCLQEVIEYLNKQGILYLSIRLDKLSPNHSADAFGKELGLSQSPVYELTNTAGGKPCVLILDQLDALRWTNRHSTTALEVCKEIVSQTAAVNKYQNGKLSIIVALRKFDLDCDAGLQRIFEENETAELQWRKICVDIFDEAEVSKIIGNSYIGFSPRLKQLLRTPSSLFIWTRLSSDVQKSNIVSVKQLMDTWWKQIQASCESAGVMRSDLLSCRDKIVHYMENRSTTVLSGLLFSDYSKTIDFLRSSGMLLTSSGDVSFTHQSFLDYFISISILNAMYSGRDIIDLIEPYDNQTPNVRYRLLFVLNDLIETDQDIFIKQARKLIQSDEVHYYFKCCVFETIGQCDNPSKRIFALLDDYFELSEWRDYILQVVYFRHPIYVQHLTTLFENWVDNTSLSILKSVADIDPVLVMKTLQPYVGKSPEDDKSIYFTLPFDITYDTEEVFSFRMDLLNKYPELLNSYFGLYDLISKQSERAIDLLAIIIKNSLSLKFEQLFLDDNSKLTKYAQLHFSSIVEKLLPLICSITKDYLPTWPKHCFYPEYEEWIASGHPEGIIRQIVDLTRYAMIELARESSGTFCSIIEQIEYPLSGIGHELIMSSIKELPLDYSDFCISWLMTDFPNKVFVFSLNDSDYLESTKAIIEKHSPHCSLPVFQALEKRICTWNDDREEMYSTAKYMLEAFRTKRYFLDGFAFWGHFQKTILPCMAQNRLSRYALELIRVLNRNEQIRLPHYYSGISSGGFGPVVSPIDDHTDKLNNRNWLQIINSPPSQMKNHFRSSKDGAGYIEASHEMFASALQKQAKLEPVRFAKLSLVFPKTCFVGYVISVLYALADTENQEGVISQDLICQVIRQYQHYESHDIANAITNIIIKNAEKDWPDDILSLLEFYAVSHPHPGPYEFSLTYGTDKEHLSPQSLLNNALNCVRGNAIRAIGHLIWHHHDLGLRFKQTIINTCNDRNDAVRYSIMFCVLPYSEIDHQFSEMLFKLLVSKDLRILTARQSWKMISTTYQIDSAWCRTVISEALRSDIEGLANHAAALICALAVFENDEYMMDTLFEFPFSEQQFEAICRQAMELFSNTEYHSQSEAIIRHIVKSSSAQLHSLGRLFYRQRIQINRDRQFLIDLMKSPQGPPLLHSFFCYLRESDSDLLDYAEVFQAIGDGVAEEADQKQRIFEMDSFIGCVIRLFDRGKDDPRIRAICLDLWDQLFMHNLHGMKQISDMIEDYD